MPTPKERQAAHVHGPDCTHDHDHDHEDGDGRHHASQTPYRRETPKPGRNDPCFCGSGRKFKKCHGAADAA
jgi:uncharacterized protein YchJ